METASMNRAASDAADQGRSAASPAQSGSAYLPRGTRSCKVDPLVVALAGKNDVLKEHIIRSLGKR